jgi:hypothetical protein
MIRHRFGGILRAARIGILRCHPSCTAASRQGSLDTFQESTDPSAGGSGNGGRADAGEEWGRGTHRP